MNVRPRPSRRQSPLSWLGWWIAWAFVLFWPLISLGPLAEGIWLILAGAVAWLAWSGRREVRRKHR